LKERAFTVVSSSGSPSPTKAQSAATMMQSVFEELGAAQTTQRGPRCLRDGLTKSPIEDWVLDLPPSHFHVVDESHSKYDGADFRLWAMPRFTTRVIAPSMKVNGIFIGSDKLGHFFEEGFLYYSEAQGLGVQEGRRRAEEWGEASERGRYGLATTGVYSNADLEANRQGFQFYRDLAANPNLSFSILKYINPNWNEETNVNFYHPAVAQVVWHNLLQKTWVGQGTINGRSFPVTVAFGFEMGRKDAALSVAGQVPGVVGLAAKSIQAGSGLASVAGAPKAEPPMSGTITYKAHNPITARVTDLKLTYLTNDTGAVIGVRIDYRWEVGDARDPTGRGRGYWVSRNESTLTGAWSNGSSTIPAGTMSLTAQ
jgi:hypothetical protein